MRPTGNAASPSQPPSRVLCRNALRRCHRRKEQSSHDQPRCSNSPNRMRKRARHAFLLHLLTLCIIPPPHAVNARGLNYWSTSKTSSPPNSWTEVRTVHSAAGARPLVTESVECTGFVAVGEGACEPPDGIVLEHEPARTVDPARRSGTQGQAIVQCDQVLKSPHAGRWCGAEPMWSHCRLTSLRQKSWTNGCPVMSASSRSVLFPSSSTSRRPAPARIAS